MKSGGKTYGGGVSNEKTGTIGPGREFGEIADGHPYGADAVYTGVEGLSLRAQQAEFTMAELEEGGTRRAPAGGKGICGDQYFSLE